MRRSVRLASFLFAVVAAGCGSTPRPVIGTPTKEQFERLKAAEHAYRAEDAGYPALRGELATDPVTAAWLTRLFVHDMFLVREGRVLGDDQDLMRAAARIEDPVESRAIQEITALGAAAVPVLVGDLLMHSQPQDRELGIELLGYVGKPAAPGVLAIRDSSDPRLRRAAARALGRLGDGADVTAALANLAHDSDYTVRADCARGLARGGAAAADLLRAMVAGDADPFVRRMAARSLAQHPGRRTALALVAYLARCTKEADSSGFAIAQESLQKLASARRNRTLESWRTWAESLPADKDR